MRPFVILLVLMASVFLLAEEPGKKPKIVQESDAKEADSPSPFTDKDLKVYLKKHPNGVIYVLSPGMYLSLKGLSEYQKITKERSLAFLPLLDPHNKRPGKNILDLNLSGIPRLQSSELIKRNALVHFPAFLIYKSGQLQGSFNPGYDAPERFAKRLRSFFQ